MNLSRSTFSRLATAVLVLALPLVSFAARKDRQQQDVSTLVLAPVDPAFIAMLGASVTPATAIDLAARLRVATQDGGDAPLASHLVAAPSANGTRYEASGLSLTIRTVNSGNFRVADARVALAPAADGHSCRFELSGIPFGSGSRLETTGTVAWGSGPLGGDGLEAVLRLDGVPVEALRAAFPKRFDPSVSGLVALDLKASGVVGETTTEDAPATPLRGQLETKADWTVVGRSGPLVVTSEFSLDDRRVRLLGGHLKWQDFNLPMQGWFEFAASEVFDLTATFAGIDSKKVAGAWNVPVEWTPVATLDGRLTWKGKPGDSILRYQATAPTIDLPAYGGWPVHVDGAKLSGGILEVNYDASASVRSQALRVGEFQLPPVPGGLQWWRGILTFATAKTPVWEGDGTVSMSYKPAEDPAFSMSGALIGVNAREMAGALLAPLGLDVDGHASMAWTFGQDVQRNPKWTVHGSLKSGRLGNIDLVAKALDALATVDASLKLPDAALLVPRPRSGAGTRVDRLFVEVEKKDGVFELGGMILGSGDFGFEADGRWSPAGGLALDGILTMPEPVAAKIAAAAPWVSALRSADGPMLVPVAVRGSTAGPTVMLDPAYAALLAKARRGEAVAPAQPKVIRHVGVAELATIPGDPSREYEQ